MPYRVEEASTGRAGCKNKECQDKKEKILKGELRLGSWIETDRIQGWAWKHWGCVTPRQIASLQDDVGEDKDYSMLDGYDEISAENQRKIREALEQGHVADSDWRGDVEVNRPGKSGFRVRAKKTKEDSKEQPSQEVDKTPQKGGKKGAKKTEGKKETSSSKKSKEDEPKKGKRVAAQEDGGDREEAASKRQKAGRKTGKPTKSSAAAAAKDVNGTHKESQKSSRARRAADRAARKES